MTLNINLLKNLPFPYFVIDRNFKILFQSNKAFEEFSFEKNFLNLAVESSRKKLKDFLSDTNDSPHLNICMLKKNLKACSVRLYKLPSDEELHLFCFPNEIDSDERLQVDPLCQKQDNEINIQVIKEVLPNNDYFASIGKLAAGIVHEIRNPLTAVKGFIQLLKPYLSEIGKEYYADVALEEINRTNEIIFEFLNNAKPNDRMKQPAHLNKIIRDVVILYKSEAILRNINITVDYDDQDTVLQLEDKQLKHILTNILNNAIEALSYRKDGVQGCIHIATKVREDHAVIFIEDNGCGMSKETLESLFLPFYSTKENGTGIGMPLCKKIIEDNGGQIEISSIVNTGTIIKVVLPVVQKAKLTSIV
ncbi:two-component sensor histidine kinase [Bacillus methanolicus]|uniref:ATP-binding protein n=1 Tax=Bacillus methanolicus TaxID=1471 RepID=UPI00200D7044|nr:ATP-binding protein [Bacillus methanolicus]UQD51976.1 two-component sensor histidine kinase [Bacillus methanolicus]